MRIFTLLLASLFCHALNAQIQLAFSGTPTLSGTAGTVGARYTYANVGITGGITIKAVVEITGNVAAGLDNIDGPASNGGTDNAFQPVVYGTQTNNNCWSMQFRISFYNAANNNPLTLSSFRASGIDIDGNGSSLREHNTFTYPYSYTVNNPTNLTVSSTAGVYQFRGPSTSYAGISLTQTNVAVTCLFNNRQYIDLSIGSCCVGANCNVAAGSGRQHSINFYDAVSYSAPLITLPVELLSFSASTIATGTLLSWATAAEINLEYFAIERSEDGSNFREIGRVTALGDNNQYNFRDDIGVTGNLYYRLRAVDWDGRYTFSPVAAVTGIVPLTRILGVSPNPLQQQFNLSMESARAQTISLQLVNLSGRLIFSSNRRVVKGTNLLPLQTGTKLASGVYLLKTVDEDGAVRTVKVMVK